MTTETVQALVTAAREGTGAAAAWLLAVRGDALTLHAMDGLDASRVGETSASEDSVARMVVASGQAFAVVATGGDARSFADETTLIGRRPNSLLCLPCPDASGAVRGALELVDPEHGSFSFDDLELATLLAGIVGSALADDEAVSDPDLTALFEQLTSLRATDAAAYDAVATMTQRLSRRA